MRVQSTRQHVLNVNMSPFHRMRFLETVQMWFFTTAGEFFLSRASPFDGTDRWSWGGREDSHFSKVVPQFDVGGVEDCCVSTLNLFFTRAAAREHAHPTQIRSG